MATSFNLGGLLGVGDGLGDLLTPEQQRAIQQRGLLSAAAALLQASGPSPTRVGLGQALGSALLAGQTGAEQAQQSALTQMLTRQKVEEARRGQELQRRIGQLLAPQAAAAPVSGEITPEEALAATGMAAGPTVERAALIGQERPPAPAMNANEIRARQYRQIADIYAASGKSEDAKRFMDIAESLAPERRDLRTITVDGKTQVVDFSKIAPGTVFGTGRDIRPITVDGKTQFVDMSTVAPGTVLGTGRDIRPITVDGKTQFVDMSTVAPGTVLGTGRDIRPITVDGKTQFVDMSTVTPGTVLGTGRDLRTITVDGKTQVVDFSTVEPGTTFGTGRDLRLVTVDGKTQVVDLGAVAPGTTFGTGRDIRPVDVGGRIQFVDFGSVAPGTTLGKTLAPQVVGGAESGYFVVGGGGGGAAPRPAAGAPAPARPPAAAGAPVAPAPAGAAPAAAPAAVAPAPAAAPALPAGVVPLIPGTGKGFEKEKDLRSEFEKAAKPFTELAQAFQKIETAAKNPSGAGDISLVYGFMKVLDPGSVVREGEFATAANAGGVPDTVRSLYNRAIQGQRLSERVREDFLSQARNLIESQRVLSNDLVTRFQGLARQYDLNPDRVTADPFRRIKTPEEIMRESAERRGGQQQPAAQPAPAVPTSRGGFFERFNLIPR